MKQFLFFTIAFFLLTSCSDTTETPQAENKNTDTEKMASDGDSEINSTANSASSTKKEPFINIKSRYDKSEDVNVTFIDEEMTICIENPENRGKIDREVICYGKAYNRWDDALNLYYKKMQTPLDENGKSALKKAQKSWLKYRDAEADFLNTFFQNIEKKDIYVRQTKANIMNYEIVRSRTLDLGYWNIILIVDGGISADVKDFIKKETEYLNQGNMVLANCIDVSTAEYTMCTDKAVKQNEQLLNENYQNLLSELNNELQSKMKSSQKAWTQFKENELEIYNNLPMTYDYLVREANARNAEMIYHRAVILKDLSSWIEK